MLPISGVPEESRPESTPTTSRHGSLPTRARWMDCRSAIECGLSIILLNDGIEFHGNSLGEVPHHEERLD
jgi:hypothetical protein